MRWPLALVLVAACGTDAEKLPHQEDYLAYAWDDRRVLCSDAIDDLENPVNWEFIDKQLALAHERGWVAILHAHTPGVTVSTDALMHVLDKADAEGLAYETFRELVPAGHGAGLALAFDDNAPDQWMTVRALLQQHHAHVTFFVSRWPDMTPNGRTEIGLLHDDGHDIEPHTIDHPHALDYVKQYGLDAYMNDEVLPSFDVLTAAGYPSASAFAYPFGEHDAELDRRLLEVVDKVRTTPGECPW
jgi:hypothetical protein